MSLVWRNPLSWAADRLWYWLAAKVMLPGDVNDVFDDDDDDA